VKRVLFLFLVSTACAFSPGDSPPKQLTPKELIAAVREMTWRTHSTAAKKHHNFIKCGVPVLKQLAETAPALDAETKKQLSELGIDTERSMAGFGRPEGLEWHYDTGIFRIHYTLEGYHAVDSTDSDSDGIPDMVELMAASAEETLLSLLKSDSTATHVRPLTDGTPITAAPTPTTSISLILGISCMGILSSSTWPISCPEITNSPK